MLLFRIRDLDFGGLRKVYILEKAKPTAVWRLELRSLETLRTKKCCQKLDSEWSLKLVEKGQERPKLFLQNSTFKSYSHSIEKDSNQTQNRMETTLECPKFPPKLTKRKAHLPLCYPSNTQYIFAAKILAYISPHCVVRDARWFSWRGGKSLCWSPRPIRLYFLTIFSRFVNVFLMLLDYFQTKIFLTRWKKPYSTVFLSSLFDPQSPFLDLVRSGMFRPIVWCSVVFLARWKKPLLEP